MNDKLEKAIRSLTDKAENSDKASDSMQFAQAALNLTQALCNLKLTKK